MKNSTVTKSSLKELVLECIYELNNSLHQYPLITFNESDIQCRLFSILMSRFGELEQVKNIFVWGTQEQLHTKPLVSNRVHSELLLARDRIDLAVLDLPNARFAFNSKGRFGYVQLEDGNHVFIEIKTTRTNRSNISSKNRWKTLISDDIKKLQLYKSYICFLLCYDFNDLLDDGCINLLAEQAGEDIEFVYIKDKFQNRYLNEENGFKPLT